MTKRPAVPVFTRTLLASALCLAFTPAWSQDTPAATASAQDATDASMASSIR